MASEAYFIGRKQSPLQAPFTGSDQIFGSERLDDATLESPTYEHCTFANISFKSAKINGGRFRNCVFVACYFRNSDIKSSVFSSCRFIDCEFPGAAFSGCDFRYTRFSGCYIPFDEIEHNLPTEPNLREQVAHILAREAAALGDPRTARTYRLCEMSAREEHYWAAVMGRSKWYRDHFDGIARAITALRYAGSLINKTLFGYGERLWVVIRNFFVATLIFFPLLYYIWPDALSVQPPTTAGVVSQPSFWVAVEFSINNAVAGALRSSIVVVGFLPRLIAAAQIILTAVWASLVASYVFRWSLRR